MVRSEEAKAVYVQPSARPCDSPFETLALNVSSSGCAVTQLSFREIEISHPLRKRAIGKDVGTG